jgi:hypothetical protein
MMGYIFSTRKKDFGMYLKMMLRQCVSCTDHSVSREHLGRPNPTSKERFRLTPTITRAHELSTGRQLPTFQTVLMPSSSRAPAVGKRMYTKICLVNYSELLSICCNEYSMQREQIELNRDSK